MMRLRAQLIVLCALASGLSMGCLHNSYTPPPPSPVSTTPGTAPSTQPLATDIDPETADAQYWLDQPALFSISSSNYERLMAECDHVLRQRFFEINRRDYRAGLLTSKPLISKQFWEFWRSDVEGWQQITNSSVSTYRRTVQWTITKTDDRAYCAVPKVVIERLTHRARRVTAVVDYRAALSNADHSTRLVSPKLASVPTNRWYALGRDAVLEESLVEDLRERLAK